MLSSTRAVTVPLAFLSLCNAANALPKPPQASEQTPEQANEGQWVTLAPLPVARQEHATVAVDENTIALVGGVHPIYNGTEQISLATTNSVHLYDIPSDTWRNATPAPVALNHPNVASANGKIYLLGGLMEVADPSPLFFDWPASGESHVYDPATDAWTALEPMPAGAERGSAAMGVHGDMIYLAGGMTFVSDEGQDGISSVLAFNMTSGAWQDVPSAAADLPGPRQHALGAVVEDTLYVLGGRHESPEDLKSDVFMLDMTDLDAGWTTAQPMPTARGGIFGAALKGDIYVFGGEGNSDSEIGIFQQAERLSLQSGEWTEMQPTELARHGTSAVAAGDRMYVGGGGMAQDGVPREGEDMWTPDMSDQLYAFVV